MFNNTHKLSIASIGLISLLSINACTTIDKDKKYNINTEKKVQEQENDAESLYRMGAMYFFGIDVEQDYQKAFKLYQKAAMQNNAIAQQTLATMYFYGYGTNRDVTLAKQWTIKSCENGYPEGCYSAMFFNRLTDCKVGYVIQNAGKKNQGVQYNLDETIACFKTGPSEEVIKWREKYIEISKGYYREKTPAKTKAVN